MSDGIDTGIDTDNGIGQSGLMPTMPGLMPEMLDNDDTAGQ